MAGRNVTPDYWSVNNPCKQSFDLFHCSREAVVKDVFNESLRGVRPMTTSSENSRRCYFLDEFQL